MDQAQHYTNPKSLRILKQFDSIKGENAVFPSYFKKFYSLKRIHRFPYDNLSCLSHRRLDFIIRFERLQDDFSRVLELVGLEQKRPLPSENETGERKSDFLAYYTPEIYGQAKKVFGPFMKKWGYDFPPQWGNSSISLWSEAHFRILGVFRKLYWKHLGYDSAFLRFFEQILP